MTSYVFQIKKCLDSNCFYCNQHPVCMSAEEFEKLSYLPLPLLDTDEEHYQPFNNLYGQIPSDMHQPSKGSPEQQEAKEIDKKKLFVNSRGVVKCRECCKPRCVFTLKKLTSAESALVEEINGSKLYVCGSPLLPSSSPYFNSIVVHQSLLCTDPVEVQYYSATIVSFPNISFYCGAPEVTLVDDSDIKKLHSQYAVVCPICFLCCSSEKRPATRQPNK